jgi:YacP-like NYN domain-containing protein
VTCWIVDAMNVIGSRPDGWWRDRPAAVRKLVDASRVVAAGGDAVTLVVDGRPAPDLPAGDHDGVRVVYAARPGRDAADDRIVELVTDGSLPADVRVVTSDRGLGTRVRAAGVDVVPASSWVRMVSGSTRPGSGGAGRKV